MTQAPVEITEQDVQTLARTLGLTIPPGEAAEVTYRFVALLEQLQRLDGLDLAGVDPTAVFGTGAAQ